MKTLLIVFALLATSTVWADEHVNGYTRSDGTYVQSYERTNPNSTRDDNYSTRGNTNPYTGQQGTQNPDSGYNSNRGYGNNTNNSGNNDLYGNRIK